MTILYEDAVACVGVFDDVQVYRWYAPPTVETLRAVARAQLDHALSVGGKTAAITVVDVGVGISISDELRRTAIETFRTMQPHLHCSAFLIEQKGFFASLARSILFGLTSVARLPYPLKAFGDLEDCVRWLDETAQEAGRRPLMTAPLVRFVRDFEGRVAPAAQSTGAGLTL